MVGAHSLARWHFSAPRAAPSRPSTSPRFATGSSFRKRRLRASRPFTPRSANTSSRWRSYAESRATGAGLSWARKNQASRCTDRQIGSPTAVPDHEHRQRAPGRRLECHRKERRAQLVRRSVCQRKFDAASRRGLLVAVPVAVRSLSSTCHHVSFCGKACSSDQSSLSWDAQLTVLQGANLASLLPLSAR